MQFWEEEGGVDALPDRKAVRVRPHCLFLALGCVIVSFRFSHPIFSLPHVVVEKLAGFIGCTDRGTTACVPFWEETSGRRQKREIYQQQ